MATKKAVLDQQPWKPQATINNLQGHTPITGFRHLNRTSSLYDAHELDTIAWELERALLPKQLDSFQLREVTQNLNAPHTAKANASTAGSTTTDLQILGLVPMSKSRTCNGHGVIHLIDGSLQAKKTSTADLQNATWKGTATALYDSFELNGITQELNQALCHPPPRKSSAKKCPSMKPEAKQLLFHPCTPIWRLSPKNRGSTLYDSYELKAVAQQLNHVIQNNRRHPSLYSHQIRSSALHNLYKENVEPRRVTCPALGRPVAAQSSKSTQRIMSRLWKKVKLTFLPNKKIYD